MAKFRPSKKHETGLERWKDEKTGKERRKTGLLIQKKIGKRVERPVPKKRKNEKKMERERSFLNGKAFLSVPIPSNFGQRTSLIEIHLDYHCLGLRQGVHIRGDLPVDHWLQSIHECSKSVRHRHGQNPQLEVTEALDVFMYKANLAQSLQLFLCLFFLYDGRKGHSYLSSKLPPVCPGCPVTCTDTGLLRLEPAASTLLQFDTNKVDPLVWSAWG